MASVSSLYLAVLPNFAELVQVHAETRITTQCHWKENAVIVARRIRR
jgi:hypothetical protein